MIHIVYHCRLGGNPCCNYVASKNPAPNEQLNCPNNSSTIQIGGHIHHNNFLAFHRLNIHGQVRNCALFIKNNNTHHKKLQVHKIQHYHLSFNIHGYCLHFHYPILKVSTHKFGNFGIHGIQIQTSQ
jgi:hypothetical protein